MDEKAFPASVLIPIWFTARSKSLKQNDWFVVDCIAQNFLQRFRTAFALFSETMILFLEAGL